MNKRNVRKNPSPDVVLKDYWRNNGRFADLFNQFFFGGKEVLKPECLTERDAVEDTMIQDSDRKILTISRERDLVKQYTNGMEFALVTIENQKNIHYGMPVRTMLYEALEYTRQCKELEQNHRIVGELQTPAEFLSGMKWGDRIHPVLTLVIYYGEEEWDGAVCLSDLTDVPEMFVPFFNNHRIHPLQMNHAGKYHFQNKDNQDFFRLVDAFYRKGGKIGLKELKVQNADGKSAGRAVSGGRRIERGLIQQKERLLLLS